MGNLRAANVLFDCYTGKVSDLLSEAGEAIEESRLTGVRWANKRYSVSRGRCPIARGQYRNACCGRATVAITHTTRSLGEVGQTVSLRRATSEPSTRNTRGSPPGAQRAAVTLMPGRKPSSINRVAKSAGRSMLSIIAFPLT